MPFAAGTRSRLARLAGDTDFGRRQSPEATDNLRHRGIVMFPSDLGIDDRNSDARLARCQDNRRAGNGLAWALHAAGKIPPNRRRRCSEMEATMTPASQIPGDLSNVRTALLGRAKQLAATLLSERGEASAQ